MNRVIKLWLPLVIAAFVFLPRVAIGETQEDLPQVTVLYSCQ